MHFYSIPDELIDFLVSNPKCLGYFCNAEIPKVNIDKKYLVKWPKKEPKSFSPEINHRTIEYFHYFLNGTQKMVSHAGCVFQTWLKPEHKTVAQTIDMNNFALKNKDVVKFKDLIERVYPEKVTERYMKLFKYTEMTDYDKQYLEEPFEELIKACNFALDHKHGLLWTAC